MVKGSDMNWGVVCILDALGFKGIWRREGYIPESIAKKMLDVKKKIVRVVREVETLFEDASNWKGVKPDIKALFISDTIIVCATIPHGTQKSKKLLLDLVSLSAQRAITLMASQPEPLVMRGCIGCGDVYIKGHVLIGPAIDDTAEVAEEAEAAIVWLLPQARACLSGASYDRSLFIEYPVPLKQGRTVETLAINPFPCIVDKKEQVEYSSSVLSTFASTKLDVYIKKTITERFLKKAKKYCDSHGY